MPAIIKHWATFGAIFKIADMHLFYCLAHSLASDAEILSLIIRVQNDSLGCSANPEWSKISSTLKRFEVFGLMVSSERFF